MIEEVSVTKEKDEFTEEFFSEIKEKEQEIPASRGGDILVVDDDPMVVKVLKGPLERAGYSVTTAHHALQALQKVKKSPPDIIILDILMPMMDGFKVARFLKFDKRFKDIPIIVLTSRATLGERKIGKKVGANEFIYKPFRLPQIMNAIQRYINA